MLPAGPYDPCGPCGPCGRYGLLILSDRHFPVDPARLVFPADVFLNESHATVFDVNARVVVTGLTKRVNMRMVSG
jgi:hypothetical protein